ncbi:MAG: hypothetical protein IIB33_01540 [Chloroflexi bacterium]|nr:hypothetical protein [Chloroflexota bacterium]
MAGPEAANPLLSDTDLDFIAGGAAPDAPGREALKRRLAEDEEFRQTVIGDEKVLQRVLTDEEAFLHLSPALYFEILLRNAARNMEASTHTMERAGRQNIPVFDTDEVVGLLSQPQVLDYLAHMLASFTRIQSYVIPVRVRRGVRRRVRYNDMDIDSLKRFAAVADGEQRFGLYKRIADVCLYVTGVFPDYALRDHRYAASGQVRPRTSGRVRRSIEDYEEEGRRFYLLAEEHPVARSLNLSNTFRLLRHHFIAARKPLSFIASNYLHSRKSQLFGAPVQ